jgi:phosphocarrier protein
MTTTATAKVQLLHPEGLHARPSVKLTQIAKTFRARIDLAIAEAGPWIDAKNILKVMAKKVPFEATLYFRATGEDAEPALDALVRLVEADFEEDRP